MTSQTFHAWWQSEWYEYSPLAGFPSLETSDGSGVAEEVCSGAGQGGRSEGATGSEPAPTLRVSASSERLPSAAARRRVKALFLKIMS